MRILAGVALIVLLAACTSAEPALTSQLESTSTTVPAATTPSVATTQSVATTASSTILVATTTLPAVDPMLLAHYPLDGNAINEVDPSGIWDGEVFGATPTEDRFGGAGSAMLFDGVDDYIEVTIGSDTEAGGARLAALELDMNTQAITIAAWMLMDAQPRDLDLWWDVVSYGFDDHVLGIHGEGGVVAGIQGDFECAFTTEGNVLDGEWHHIAMTRDARGATSVYLDGVQMEVVPQNYPELAPQLSFTCPREPLVSRWMWIGSCLDFEEFFDGAIDDVRVYGAALAPEDIGGLYSDR